MPIYFTASKTLLAVSLALVLGSCAGNKPYSINLMPTPGIFISGEESPFENLPDDEEDFPDYVLYATDRTPAEERSKSRHYGNKRGHLLRVGRADVELGVGDLTVAEILNITSAAKRKRKYPLRLKSVEELGVLERTRTVFRGKPDPDNPLGGGPQFARDINRQLRKSSSKSIFIYVHGFKVVFADPILVASELWHFMGYEGVSIAYSWPSTPSLTAYFGDVETATYAARNFRLFLEFLAEKTDARRINIIAYSAGTRMVARALEHLALTHAGEPERSIQRKTRLGSVILVGSDIDRNQMSAYLADDILNVMEQLNVYVSEEDSALGFTNWLLGRERLGQLNDKSIWTPEAIKLVRDIDGLSLINVTKAEQATRGNGHGYFRKSPWVSTDVLMTLRYGLTPEKRGLLPKPDDAMWHFPPDYMQRARAILKRYH